MREEGSGVLLTATLAGLVAAVVGGIVWGLLVRWTDYEIGFAAWGIGFIVGTAVVFGAQRTRGLPFQVIAVALALVGIVLGKYLAFVWVGQDQGFALPVFSKDTFDLFWDVKSEIWSAWDLLWAGLAVVTAFRIPQIEREEATEPASPAQVDTSQTAHFGQPSPPAAEPVVTDEAARRSD